MAIKLGVAPIAWSNNDLAEIGGKTPLETCLAEARAAGYTGVESGIKFPNDAAKLGPILKKHGLQLVSGWYSGELVTRSVAEEQAAMADQLAMFAALGAPVMIYGEVAGSVQGAMDKPLSKRPHLPDGEWKAYGKRLTEMAEHMADKGVRMAYHHHMGAVCEREPEIDKLMSVTGPAVGLLVDSGHLSFAGADVVGVTRRYGKRVVHVHCKDIRPQLLAKVQQKDMSFLAGVLDGVFTVPGDGFIDFSAFFQALAEINYAGWVVVEAEQDPAKADAYTYARVGAATLKRAAAAAGLALAG